jgi:flagellar assembly factor FliW
MSIVATRFFGPLEYSENSLFFFPSGLPGFESFQRFVIIAVPEREPLIFLQSLDISGLCFILLPIRTIDDHFRLDLTAEEISEIGLPQEGAVEIGKDVLCAAIINSTGDKGPTANLMAPVVVNLRNNVGVQVIQTQSGYSHSHPIVTARESVC